MKFAIALLVTTILLTSCGAVDLGDSKTKSLILPDVPQHPVALQQQAAGELEFLMKTFPDRRPASLTIMKSCHVMTLETRVANRALGVRD